MRDIVRAAVVDGIIAVVNDSTVWVDLEWPAETGNKDMIWLGPSMSTAEAVDVPVFRGQPSANNPIVMDDHFTIPVHIHAGSVGSSARAAEARAGVLYGQIRSGLAADPGLGTLSDPVVNPHAQLMWVLISGLSGPFTGEDPTGPASRFLTELTAYTREQ